jgi:hypothetical protein
MLEWDVVINVLQNKFVLKHKNEKGIKLIFYYYNCYKLMDTASRLNSTISLAVGQRYQMPIFKMPGREQPMTLQFLKLAISLAVGQRYQMQIFKMPGREPMTLQFLKLAVSLAVGQRYQMQIFQMSGRESMTQHFYNIISLCGFCQS